MTRCWKYSNCVIGVYNSTRYFLDVQVTLAPKILRILRMKLVPGVSFLSVFTMTPRLHHTYILPFTQQSLENIVLSLRTISDLLAIRESALHQVMEKQNRLEYLRDTGANRPKHHQIQTCGHTGLTCPHMSTSVRKVIICHNVAMAIPVKKWGYKYY